MQTERSSGHHEVESDLVTIVIQRPGPAPNSSSELRTMLQNKLGHYTKTLVALANDQGILVFDLTIEHPVYCIYHDWAKTNIYRMAFLSEFKLVITAGEELILWDLVVQRIIKQFKAHGLIHRVLTSGDYIIIMDQKRIIIWNTLADTTTSIEHYAKNDIQLLSKNRIASIGYNSAEIYDIVHTDDSTRRSIFLRTKTTDAVPTEPIMLVSMSVHLIDVNNHAVKIYPNPRGSVERVSKHRLVDHENILIEHYVNNDASDYGSFKKCSLWNVRTGEVQGLYIFHPDFFSRSYQFSVTDCVFDGDLLAFHIGSGVAVYNRKDFRTERLFRGFKFAIALINT